MTSIPSRELIENKHYSLQITLYNTKFMRFGSQDHCIVPSWTCPCHMTCVTHCTETEQRKKNARSPASVLPTSACVRVPSYLLCHAPYQRCVRLLARVRWTRASARFRLNGFICEAKRLERVVFGVHVHHYSGIMSSNSEFEKSATRGQYCSILFCSISNVLWTSIFVRPKEYIMHFREQLNSQMIDRNL